MTLYVFNSDNYASRYQNKIGGKARNLFLLKEQGINVPEFICLNADAYDRCTEKFKPEINKLLQACSYSDYQSIRSTSDEIKSLILSCDIKSDVFEQFESSMVKLADWHSFSVRSSASNEDGNKNSFAGQLGTWLNVSKNDIEEKIKACWASAFEPGILTYMNKLGIDCQENRVSVVVQRMVEAECSGVMFQADPKGNVNKQVIAAGYGLGEGVVSDKVETDLYTYDKLNGEWQLKISKKSSRLDF